ncbi:MAG: type IX secretion system sortase PorU [Candidatus Azobacteroides sp.]|nr:type IX secretion system sortase PorU [Candidatus Azobacteroides sp.]
MKFFTSLILSVFCFISFSYADNRSAHSINSDIESSVLSSGKWVKIRISETGIYKITYEDLITWGFNNPSRVQLYGYGGWPLDERIDQPRINDLPRVGIQVEKGDDNIFNEGDYFLFYGKGTTRWEYNSSKGEFIHTNNPYSKYGYYFLYESNAEAIEMEIKDNNSLSFTNVFSDFNDYYVHEQDLVNLGKTGREFYGESFTDNTEQVFTFDIPGIKQDTDGVISIDFIAKTSVATPLQVSVNNTLHINTTVPVTGGEYFASSLTSSTIWKRNTMQESNEVKVIYGTQGHANAYLNYIRINCSRELKPYGTYTLFRNTSAINTSGKFVLDTSEDISIWNVTDAENIYEVKTLREEGKTYFISPAHASLQEYVAIDFSSPEDFLTPEVIGEIKNQNLHNLSQADMIIITHSDYLAEATRLGNFHYEEDNLTYHVVTAEEIYNEFSSGTPDASAYRWFMKMFYDRGIASGKNDIPQYLLLFGDGIYDNRGIETEFSSKRLLTYQSLNSLHNGYQSYVTDDYFGFLDDNNNTVDTQNNIAISSYGINVGIGRIPVKTVREAQIAVDKIINYTRNNIYDQWRNTINIVGDYGDDYLHMEQADSIAREYFERRNKDYIVNKIYVETYKKISSQYPDAVNEFINSINAGTLVMNYVGHGSMTSLSGTALISKEVAKNLTNERLPLFLTFTCGFSRYDQEITSTGEELLLNPNGGVIALISTVRTVNSSSNFRLNRAMAEYYMDKDLRLGDVFRLAKTSALMNSDVNKLSYTLLGDPALKLAFPQQKAEITTINNINLSTASPTLEAGEKVEVSGFINNANNEPDENFSGIVYMNLYDSKELLQDIVRENSTTKVKDTTHIYGQSKLLFIGKGEVKNSKFTLSFIMPKEINYSYDAGKIHVYAVSDDYKKDAHGHSAAFKVGGTADTEAMKDNVPPQIHSLYIGDVSFQNGDIVSPHARVVIEVEDEESGINISGSGIGHNVSLTFDNSMYQVYNLNAFFENELNNPKKGKFVFPLPADLSRGTHSMKFKVWDIMNNSAEKTIYFELTNNLIDLIAVPDFTSKKVSFFIENNSSENEDAEMSIEVYDLSGKAVWTNTQTVNINILSSFPVKWDITHINSGIYVYKATIKTENNTTITEARRIIVK